MGMGCSIRCALAARGESQIVVNPRGSERTARLFDALFVDHHPSDRSAIHNHTNPPLGLWFGCEAERPIVLRWTGVSIDDLIGNPNETSALGSVLEVLDHVAFFAGNRLPRKSP